MHIRLPSVPLALLIPAVAGLGLLSGCANQDAAIFRPMAHRQLQLLDTMPASTSTAPTTLAASAGPNDYVRLALRRNPTIAAAQLKVRRMLARIPQATSLEDPMLEVTPVGEMAQTAAGQVGVMMSVSQTLPFFGKLAARGDIAGREVAQAAAELEQAKLAVTADVRRAYWSYYFAARSIDVTQQSRQLFGQFRQTADSRFRSGQANQSDVLRANVELSRLDNELITLEQRRTTAAAMLNSLLDQPPNTPLPDPRPPTDFDPAPLDLPILLARSTAANPELARLSQRVEAERHRQTLARLQRWPDLTLRAGYSAVNDDGLAVMANGKDQWWIGFGINVPIWFARYEAAEREALAGRQEAMAELAAARNRIAFQVQDGVIRVQTQQRQVRLFKDVILPQARQVVEASRTSYQTGQTDFLTLVDNWRRLFDYELLHQQSLTDLEKSLADLEQVVGRPLAEANLRPPPASQPVELDIESTRK